MRRFFRLLIWLAVLLGIAVVFLRATCLEVWTIPADDPLFSASILPGLSAGDVIVLLRRGTPQFGDLVRCDDPEAEGRYVIGRIVGEPGDRVVADGLGLDINGKRVATPRACAPATMSVDDPVTHQPVDLPCEMEELGGSMYARLRAPRRDAQVTTYKVSADHLFIASDNRRYHDDSRDFGEISKAACTERILFRLWSDEGWGDEKSRLTYIH